MAKVVVLDVDGTLMDTNYLHTEAWARAFEEVGPPDAEGQVPQTDRQGLGASDPRVRRGRGGGGEIRRAARRDTTRSCRSTATRSRGRRSSSPRWSSGATTSGSSPAPRTRSSSTTSRSSEAEGKISGVVNSSAVENPKPAPDIFEEALQRAGASPDETVAVGDAVWDVEAAKGAGIRTVAVLSGGAYDEEDLEEAGAVEVYEDCAALLELRLPGVESVIRARW